MQELDPKDFFHISPIILLSLALGVSCIISLYTVKKIIFIADHRKIYDIPDDVRKFHGVNIPSLGGVGIFIGYIVTAAFFMLHETNGWNYVVASTVLLFFTGVYDDLMNMNPTKKLLLQLIASVVTVYFANVRIVSFDGVFGIGEIPYWVSLVVTTLACTFFINVFNFIDGIDGLACSMAVFCLLLFSVFLTLAGQVKLACIAVSLAGATGGLFYYNVAPAKVYMGDTGSMVLGFSIFILGLRTINCYAHFPGIDAHTFLPAIHGSGMMMLVVFSVLFLPVYDAFRVFAIRIARGVSPLRADRSHLHYYLLDAGFSHTTSVLILVGANAVLAVTGLLTTGLPAAVVLSLLIVEATALVLVTYRLRKQNLAATGKS